MAWDLAVHAKCHMYAVAFGFRAILPGTRSPLRVLDQPDQPRSRLHSAAFRHVDPVHAPGAR